MKFAILKSHSSADIESVSSLLHLRFGAEVAMSTSLPLVATISLAGRSGCKFLVLLTFLNIPDVPTHLSRPCSLQLSYRGTPDVFHLHYCVREPTDWSLH